MDAETLVRSGEPTPDRWATVIRTAVCLSSVWGHLGPPLHQTPYNRHHHRNPYSLGQRACRNPYTDRHDEETRTETIGNKKGRRQKEAATSEGANAKRTAKTKAKTSPGTETEATGQGETGKTHIRMHHHGHAYMPRCFEAAVHMDCAFLLST